MNLIIGLVAVPLVFWLAWLKLTNQSIFHKHWFVPRGYASMKDAFTLRAEACPGIVCACACGKEVVERRDGEWEPIAEMTKRINSYDKYANTTYLF